MRKYPDRPVVSVGVVIFKGDKILLIQRGNEPNKGCWSIPGGAVELGETIREAATREVREECGIEIAPGEVLEVVDAIVRDEQGGIKFHYVLIDLLAEYRGGALSPQSDILDACWTREGDLDRFDIFPTTLAIIRRAFSKRGGGC
jgi:8-oxo-dGTP diphosphatase